MLNTRKPALLAGLALLGCAACLLVAFTSVQADELKEDRKTEAAPADESDGEAALSAAIDREIAKVWERDGIKPAPTSGDAEFLRRAYLDTVGMPPSADEAAAFIDDKTPDKRNKLIDKLVDDPRFGEHLADMWLEVLVGRGKANQNTDLVLGTWLAEQFNENRGFDQVMYDMITATGSMADNPAVAYYGAKKEIRTPDVAGLATKHFTGVQIQCAQCHDHPYEPDWKTADFDGVASFFAPMQVRSKGSERPKQAKISDTRVKAMDSGKLKKKLANADDAKKEKLKEAAKWDSPKFLEGAELKGTDSRLWRKSWAKWVIARDNTQTQRYVANRFWSFLFGMGILNPVDDFNSFNEPSHPELLALLGNEIRDHGFDIKRFYRAVMKTRTWQLASRGEDKKAEPWHFAAYPVRQLTPEQFFAALIVVRHESASQRGMRGGGNPYDKDLQQAKAYQKRVEAGKIGKNEKKYEWDVDAIEKLKAQVDKMSDDWYLRRRVSRDYSKFSDDDEMMEADGFVLTIDQALLVMNGDITAILSDWGKGSVLDGITSSSDKLERQIERMFLVALSRKPDDSEAKRYKQFLKEAEDEKAAWEDALFTLLVSTEFATNH